MVFTKIAGAALNQTPFDWENNLFNIRESISIAKKDGVKILCLPELCLTGYGCEDVFLAPWLAEKALTYLLTLIPETKGITVSIGLPIRFNNLIYNCACFISNGEIKGFTAKQFLANDGIHYESRWFTPWPPGKSESIFILGKNIPFGDVDYEVDSVKIGFEICEDAWRPDDIRPACRHAKKGIQLILNPSASHFAFGKSKIRYDLFIGSSSKFNCVYLYSNLLGNESGRIIYDGEVLIANRGNLIQRNDRLSFKNINLVTAEIDFQSGETKQQDLFHDEREKEFEFWEATSLGLFDYLRKSKSKAFVLSLSGGADSSACAIMVAEMIRKGLNELCMMEFLKKLNLPVPGDEILNSSIDVQENYLTSQLLYTAYQGTKNSGNDTFSSAKELAESIGAKFYHWEIDEEVDGYIRKIETAINENLSWDNHDVALQNIQARARSPIIWLLTNLKNALLITTSNRSEGDVGYTTMDGDTSGSIAPIAGVDKHFIRNWLIWAETFLKHKGLYRVNRLIPTAELRPPDKTQTDEKDLMPYEWLAKIEREAVLNRLSPVQVYHELKDKFDGDHGMLKSYIRKYFTLWCRNQWKRERIAPSFHLDEFNVDPRSWCRFPILSGSYQDELKELENI